MWTVLLTDDSVAELEALPDEQQARFTRIRLLIEEHGLDHFRLPHARHIEGPLWEIRLRGQDGIARALYVVRTGQRLIVVRVFIKKTEKTPRREIELALKRAKDTI